MVCECEVSPALNCECSVCDSDCISVSGSGNATSLSFEWNIDTSEDNLVSCTADGLLAELPVLVDHPPKCRLYRGVVQSIPNDFGTRVDFDSSSYDNDGMHSVTVDPERITFNTPGLYTCVFGGAFAAGTASSGDRAAHIRKNGSEFIGGSSRFAMVSTTLDNGLNVVCHELFEAGEYVEVFVKQDNGTALNLQAGAFLAVRYRREVPDV